MLSTINFIEYIGGYEDYLGQKEKRMEKWEG